MSVELASLTSLPTTPPNGFHQSFEWSVEVAAGNMLSVGDVATPKSPRLIDCRAFLDKNMLRVVEWQSLEVMKMIPYSAISYVWKGNRKSHPSDSFAVEGASDSDRVDIEVFRVACTTAVERGADYLWLDQLCIMQMNEEDKNWQVQHMAIIYTHCRACLVLLGGIGGLVGEDETTSWINRCWTLQEALLPPSTLCIFKWSRGHGKLACSTMSCPIDTNGTYGVLPLYQLITFSLNATTGFSPFLEAFSGGQWPKTGPKETISFLNMLSHNREAPLALTNALTKAGSMNLNEQRKEELESTIWRCVMMRTATKDLDAVFSAMGLFGVQLDPSHYETQLQALIALLQKSMENGRRATWLAASIITPGIIPLLPTSTFQRVPSIETPHGVIEAHVLTRKLSWYLSNAPLGSLDDAGALTIVAPISPVRIDDIVSSTNNFLGFNLVGNMGSKNKVFLSGKGGAYAVKLGQITLISSPSIARFLFPQTTLIMLLEPDGGRWCKVGMAAVPPAVTDGWEEKQIIIFGNSDAALY
jgi:hypothetical protein